MEQIEYNGHFFWIDREHPSRRFGGGPSGAKIPPPAPPVPTPTPLDEEVLAKQRARRRQKIATSGVAGTILTEGSLGGSGSGQQTSLLGGGG